MTAASQPQAPRAGAGMRSVRWTSLGNGVRMILATGQLLVIARLVSVAEFGLVVLVTSLMQIAQQISDVGLSSALIRFRDVTDGEKSSLFWLNVLIGCGLCLLTMIGAPLAAASFNSPQLAGMLMLAATMFIAQGLFLQLRVLAERDLRFERVMQVEMSATLVGFIVAVWLAIEHFGAYSVVIGQVVASFVQLALSWLLLTSAWKPTLHFRWHEVRRFLGYGMDILIVNIAIAVTVQTDLIIAGLFFPKVTFGTFAQPRDLGLKIMMAINPIITRVGLPLIAQYQHDPLAAGRIYLRVIRMSASVCIPVYAAMGLLGPTVIPLLLGAKWAAAGLLMPWVAVWFALRCIVNPLGSFMYAMGRSRLALFYQVGFAVSVALACIVSARFGPVALICTMSATYLAFIELSWAFVLRPLSSIGFRDYHRQIVPPLTASVLAVAAVLAAGRVLGEGIPVLVASLAVGALVFALSTFTLNRPWVEEVMRFANLPRAR